MKIPPINSLIYWHNFLIKKDSLLKKFIDKKGLEKYLLKLEIFNKMEITGKNVKVISIPPLKQTTRDYLLNQIYKNDI